MYCCLMDIVNLVNILSGSVSYEKYGSFPNFVSVEFPPPVGSMWQYRKTEVPTRVLITGVNQVGQWWTITVVTSKGVSTGDFTGHDEWVATFEPFDLLEDPT